MFSRCGSVSLLLVQVACNGPCPVYQSTDVQPSCGGKATDGAEVNVRCDGVEKSPFRRYCEIFEVVRKKQILNVTIWNTIGCCECPDELLSGVQFGIRTGLMQNGPRYWQMDSIVQASPPSSAVGPDGWKLIAGFNGIGTTTVATMTKSVSDLFKGDDPYTYTYVARETVWRWRPGRQVYQLLNGEGQVFTMQAYSEQVEHQTLASILTLGSRLDLPSGWSYRCRKLGGRGINISANASGIATITQDELKNTYMLTEGFPDSHICPTYSDEECSPETEKSIERACAALAAVPAVSRMYGAQKGVDSFVTLGMPRLPLFGLLCCGLLVVTITVHKIRRSTRDGQILLASNAEVASLE
jgi:hypothetical protein